MVIDAPGPVWPQIGRGGHLRNANGEALVLPAGKKRHLVYRGASDLWPFDGPYRGDPIHGERGTHVHSICDHADAGQPLDDEFVARGVELGISAELQAYIYARWMTFLKAHGFTVTAVEKIVVNDTLRVASNIDRIVARDGDEFVMDIKSGNGIVKAATCVQLAAYAHPDTVGYDPSTGERS